ncbi:LOW QUALITY PROTEIN: probable G-protein coupled receptor Mth-like 2 [Drosophila sechellia]|uniref:LOW QUALITY PROTEIN: probable G-protein coupled receptor Mth-like 2 n=1 Tax=Drosophila sechellia TaxID=7238 RepID=UPI0013DDA22F|nr:LOW QUALITY PROTEIN: probable G-protein coupled receptor Mth-like 2 [Drosophila sechellia]
MLLFGSVLIYLLLNLQSLSAEIADCSFFDTVDISEGQRLSNGSYLYEGLLIPAHLTATYEFKLLANGDKEQVPSHVRGCVCKLRTCVRFCCPHDHIMDEGGSYANMTTEEAALLDPILNVTLDDGSVVQRHFKKELMVQWDLPLPCDDMFYLDNRDNIAGSIVGSVLYPACGTCKPFSFFPPSAKSWSAMLYFYGPMVLLILFNITMFVLTAKHLIDSKRTMRKFARQEGRIQKLNSDKQNYTLFLLLFTAMGMSWSFKIFSFLVQRDNLWVNVFLVADYFNWSQGIIIFMLFILRRKTLVLFKQQIFPKERIFSMRSTATQSTLADSISHH